MVVLPPAYCNMKSNGMKALKKAKKELRKHLINKQAVKSFYCNRCKLPFTKEELQVNEHCNNCGQEMQ